MLILPKNLLDVVFRIEIEKDVKVNIHTNYIGSDFKGVQNGEAFIYALTSAIAFIAEKMPDKDLQLLNAVEALEDLLLEPEHDTEGE